MSTTASTLRLDNPSWTRVSMWATADGISVKGIELGTLNAKNLRHLRLLNQNVPFCIYLLDALTILYEMDLFEDQVHALGLRSENVYELYDRKFGLREFLPGQAPFVLKIRCQSFVGSPDFSYEYEFWDGPTQIFPSKLGAFVTKGTSLYVLPESTYKAIRCIETFAARSVEERRLLSATLTLLSEIQALARRSNFIELDSHLAEQQIVPINKVGVDVIRHGVAERFSLVPIFEEAPKQEIRKLFLTFGRPKAVYDLREGDSWKRFVPSESVIQALYSMYRFYRIPKDQMRTVVEHPLQIFANAQCLDAVDMSNLEDLLASRDSRDRNEKTHQVDLDLNEEYRLTEIVINEERIYDIGFPFAKIDCEVPQRNTNDEFLELPLQPNETELKVLAQEDDFFANTQAGDNKLTLQLPLSLLPVAGTNDCILREHQRYGVAWLQSALSKCVREKKMAGVLLADDMGLGKTVQVLTFLAWLLEKRHLINEVGLDGPILIVTPVSLLNVWQTELKRFFFNSGQIFLPSVVLHGEELQVYKGSDNRLDECRIKHNKLVITNFDTITAHFDSLSKIEWSVVVLDEAQTIKESKTTVSQCAKALKRRFSLALTGTPVENRLLDLWSLMEFVSPSTLGSRQDFVHTFTIATTDDSTAKLRKSEALRDLLRLNRADALLLRRTKEGVLKDLPPRVEYLRITPLTSEQRNLHVQIAAAMKKSTDERDHLKWLQHLLKLYQHTALRGESARQIPVADLLEQSAKLKDVVSLLNEIKARDEKVLIFTRYIEMQLLLKRVIEELFQVPVDIINGSSARSTGGAKPIARTKIIEQFECFKGFNCLILSPEVAGVGLTITGANNVIHYGRWWNPAVESQATDRVYRIGQKKPVHVYYPVSSGGEFPTLDERLHLILARKKELARNFLVPSEQNLVPENEIALELVNLDFKEHNETGIMAHELGKMTSKEIECLVAAIWRNQCEYVQLLNHESPQMARVIAKSDDTIYVIACLASVKLPLREVCREIKQSIDFYSGLSQLNASKHSFQGVLVTSVTLSPQAVIDVKDSIRIWERTMLLQAAERHKITWVDLFREDMHRISRADGMVMPRK